MTEKDEKEQKTKKGHEIPVPSMGQFFRNLEEATKLDVEANEWEESDVLSRSKKEKLEK